ncbi:MAG: hypothetical protein IT433_04670 [Phycisphaerales bacterium]|nr:hypothetical protein [Phycisphaerales bacterium]
MTPLLAWCASVLLAPQPGALSPELRALLDRAAAYTGSVEAVYTDPNGAEVRVGVDAATGAYYYADHSMVQGRNREGQSYSRDRHRKHAAPAGSGTPFESLRIAGFYPNVWLAEIRRYPDAVIEEAREGDLLRVRVDTSKYAIPGEQARVPADVWIDSLARVVRVGRADTPGGPRNVHLDEKSPIPVSTSLGSTEFVLASLEYRPEGAAEWFDKDRVEGVGAVVRYNSTKASAAARAAGAGGDGNAAGVTIPTANREGPNLALLACGVTLAGIGVTAWWIRRKGRA